DLRSAAARFGHAGGLRRARRPGAARERPALSRRRARSREHDRLRRVRARQPDRHHAHARSRPQPRARRSERRSVPRSRRRAESLDRLRRRAPVRGARRARRSGPRRVLRRRVRLLARGAARAAVPRRSASGLSVVQSPRATLRLSRSRVRCALRLDWLRGRARPLDRVLARARRDHRAVGGGRRRAPARAILGAAAGDRGFDRAARVRRDRGARADRLGGVSQRRLRLARSGHRAGERAGRRAGGRGLRAPAAFPAALPAQEMKRLALAFAALALAVWLGVWAWARLPSYEPLTPDERAQVMAHLRDALDGKSGPAPALARPIAGPLLVTVWDQANVVAR